EPFVDQVPKHLSQLPGVLHTVGALPLRGAPLLGGDVPPAREPGPVRLDQFPTLIRVRLSVGHGTSHDPFRRTGRVGGSDPGARAPRRWLLEGSTNRHRAVISLLYSVLYRRYCCSYRLSL